MFFRSMKWKSVTPVPPFSDPGNFLKKKKGVEGPRTRFFLQRNSFSYSNPGGQRYLQVL